jgi:hypothetical protein
VSRTLFGIVTWPFDVSFAVESNDPPYLSDKVRIAEKTNAPIDRRKLCTEVINQPVRKEVVNDRGCPSRCRQFRSDDHFPAGRFGRVVDARTLNQRSS